MIGNDIVDLALAQKESNWKRRGYLDKVFTQKEQRMIAEANTPEIMVWNLWSRKEACYKIYNRQAQIRAFIPLQLECATIETKTGVIYGNVVCYNSIYYTKTIITPDFVETIAVQNLEDFEKIKPFILGNKIVKTNGIPNYFDANENVLKPLSKSHHGRFERMICF